MSFEDMLQSDMAATFTGGEFAESITYQGKSVQGVAVHNPLEPFEVDGTRARTIVVTVARADVAAVDVGADIIACPEHPGGTPVDWRVVEIEASDMAAWRLVAVQ